jgi:hypothetical protein
MHYGRVTIANTYPACVIFLTRVDDICADEHFITVHRLRSALDLQDGDTVEFKLLEYRLWKWDMLRVLLSGRTVICYCSPETVHDRENGQPRFRRFQINSTRLRPEPQR